MDKYFNINENHYSIRCKLYSDDPHSADTLILFGHGFGGHKDNGAAEKFARHVLSKNHGAAVVTFNWPCHGDDVRKKLRLADCSAYLDILIEYLRAQFAPRELDAYATSFGAYLFLKYIAEKGDPFRRAAFRCPAVNMYDVLTVSIMKEDEREQLARGKTASVGFDRKIEIDPEFLAELKDADITKYDYLPFADELLILHGTADEIVPFDAARTFAEDNCIDFIPVEGADHRFRDARKMDLAVAKITEFLGLR